MIADVTALMEDLRALSDAVPILTEKLGAAQQGAEALETAAEQLEQAVGAARQDAASRLAALREALPELVTQAETEETQLKEAAASVPAAWQQAEPEATRIGDAVLEKVDDVLSHAQDLREAMAEAGTKIEAALAAGEAALSRLEQQTQDAEQRLEAALEKLKSEVDQFKQFADASDEALTDAARELVGSLTATCSEADAAAPKTLEAMTARTGVYKDFATIVVSMLGGEVKQKVDEAQAQIEQAVTTPLGAAEDQVTLELQRMEVSAGTQEEELVKHGQALDDALVSLDSEAKVLPAGIANIHEAARKLGI